MKQLRFKVGDEAKIIDNTSNHGFSIGTKVTIDSFDAGVYYMMYNGVGWWGMDEELEPVSAPENIGDLYLKQNINMNILYGEQKNTVETYTYTINQGGELNIKVANSSGRTVSIIFENNVFKKAEHNIEGSFLGNRSHWYILGAIAAKIKELEDSYAGKFAPKDELLF